MSNGAHLMLQVGGMNVKLTGEANDYVGKGMAGGDIVIVPPPAQTLDVRIPCSDALQGACVSSMSRILQLHGIST